MIQEFAVIVSQHRKLGVILVPYVLTGTGNQPFRRLEQQVSPEIVESCLMPLNEEQQQVVKICGEYSERNLHKLFAKRKSVKEFLDLMDDKLLSEMVRPYIEKRMVKCLDFLRTTDIPVYNKEKNYQIVYAEDRLNLPKHPAKPLFHFSKSYVESRYFLSIQSNNKEIKLTDQLFEILTNQPCNVLIDRTLYSIDNIDAKKLLPFFTKPYIAIPRAQEKAYFSTFILNAIKHYEVKAEGFTIERPEVEKWAVLSLENNLNGFPAFLLTYVYNNVSFTAGSEAEPKVIFNERDGKFSFTVINREENWEKSVNEDIKKFNIIRDSFSFFSLLNSANETVTSLYSYINWLNEHKEELENKGIYVNLEKLNGNYFTGSINIDVKINEDKDWFDVKAIVRFGEFEFPFWKLRKYILEGNREFILPDGAIAIIPEEWMARFRDIFVLAEGAHDQIKIKRYHYQLLNNSLMQGASEVSLKELTQSLELTDNENVDVPVGLNAELRQYQKIGLSWMQALYRNHFGGCLADDMGLGKTIQTISHLLEIKNKEKVEVASIPGELFDTVQLNGSNSPTSLIVMPVSLIHNWEREIRKFAPSLMIHKFTGAQRTRNVLNFNQVDLVLTSYGVVRNDIELLKKYKFHYIILDESQAIKNPDSKIYKAVLELQSAHRMVITGTPIENSLTDLWAQMNFLNKGLLGSLPYFRDEFLYPIEKQQDDKKREKLNFLIHPFILRRKKEMVAPELPEVTEQVMLCEMSADQKHEYEEEKSKIRNIILENIEQQGIERSSIVILKGLNRLRLMANHPVLTEPEYTSDSGKFEEITRSIENVIEEGHKLLIFSSYVKHLVLVQNYLEERNCKYSILTGATRDRAKVISDFTNNEDNKVFLISLKAGGTGLNLTAADYVFILDPWWNPAAENQAISRAHRIGQNKKVFVYRFITSDSIEEKILQLQERKSAIADMFINNNNPFRGMSHDDIKNLFD
jgi:SNF2 family DNA or RNA helicase